MFIVSTLGVATASATQLGHSPVYYFDVTYNCKVTGYVIIDTAPKTPKTPTYTFVGWGLTANQKYDLWYTTTVTTPFHQLTELHYVGNGTTNRAGVLMTHGDVAISQHELQTTTFQLSPIGTGNLPPLVAVLSVSDALHKAEGTRNEFNRRYRAIYNRRNLLCERKGYNTNSVQRQQSTLEFERARLPALCPEHGYSDLDVAHRLR